MNIFIRAYGSHLMGMGHLYRIKKFVNYLKKEDANITITLLTRKYDESVNIYKTIQVDKIVEIDPNISKKDEIDKLKNIFHEKYDIMINDQLNTDNDIAKILTNSCEKSITFDDLGNGNHLFDYIVNVLYPSDKKLNNEINSYNYMILDDFSTIKKSIKFQKEIKTIFINQGAADTWGAIPDMIRDLNLISENFKIKVLLGPSFKHYNELAKVLKDNKKQIEIFNFTDSVIEVVKDCDLAILGAGNTLFEVASLGIPIVASTREEKELITINRLLKESIVYAENKIYTTGLDKIVVNVMKDKDSRELQYEKNRQIFNYDGLEKITKLIMGE